MLIQHDRLCRYFGKPWPPNFFFPPCPCCAYDVATDGKLWAVGDNGYIIKSTDGGTTWVQQTSGTTRDLYCVHFIDELTGWAGPRGNGTPSLQTILHTTDGGTTWGTYDFGTNVDFVEIDFIDTSIGWAIQGGGKIWKTTDGGSNWFEVADLTAGTLSLSDIKFADENIGWVFGSTVGGGNIKKTIDGGVNWVTQTTTGAPGFTAGHVESSTLVWSSSVGTPDAPIWGTTDGINWAELGTIDDEFAPPTTQVTLRDVVFISDSVGFVCGSAGVIAKTTNGGTTWTQQDDLLFAWGEMHFAPRTGPSGAVGWVVSGDGINAKIAITVDGGANWSLQTPPASSQPLRAIHGVHS